MSTIVTLMTDFGTADGFVGAMKGVILSRAPHAQIVDITHEIAPQRVFAAAWALRESSQHFPPGTIHVVVVDPGVGTSRRPLVVAHEGQIFVGPDNGVLSLAAPQGEAWHADRTELYRKTVSRTFHGRDVFAPLAGFLAAGRPLHTCGSRVADWVRIHVPQPRVEQQHTTGQVVHVDRFGNLITNIAREELPAAPEQCTVRVEQVDVGPIRKTFADVAPGAWVAYMGSGGQLELAVRDGDAAAQSGGMSSEVQVRRRERS